MYGNLGKKKRERVLFRLLAAVLSYKNVRCIYQINVILLLIEHKLLDY